MNNLWHIILGLVITAHGIGHFYFLIPALGIANWDQKVQSWLLDSLANGALVRPLSVLVWLLTTGIFIASGLGVWLGQLWWRDLAVTGAILSLLGVAVFATGLPLNPTINPVVFNIVTLVMLLVLNWPATALAGS